ncbi:MAG: hypothetical protein RLZ37_873 [Actinomycetota bacterium]|jgi:hypothetical protein
MTVRGVTFEPSAGSFPALPFPDNSGRLTMPEFEQSNVRTGRLK